MSVLSDFKCRRMASSAAINWRKKYFLAEVALPAAGRPHTKMCETAEFAHGWLAGSADGE
jgi:hypothetical protein